MRITLIAFTFAVAFAADAASADVIEYGNDDRDQWFMDVGGSSHVSTVDFTGFDDFTPIDDQWAHLGVNFSGFVVTVGPDPLGFPNDSWGARGEPDINITFDEPMQWVATDVRGTLQIELYSNDTLFHTSQIFFPDGPAGGFGGLVSDVPFDFVRIFDPLDSLVFIDDLHFGPPIPAPASLAPFALLLCARSRRNRRRSKVVLRIHPGNRARNNARLPPPETGR